MSKIVTLLALAGLLACGGSDATAPQHGSVIFKVDAQTCSGSGTINFFIDGSQVGTQVLAAGQSSNPFQTTAGSHLVGASEPSGYTWASMRVDVPANASYTAVLTC